MPRCICSNVILAIARVSVRAADVFLGTTGSLSNDSMRKKITIALPPEIIIRLKRGAKNTGQSQGKYVESLIRKEWGVSWTYKAEGYTVLL